MSGIWVASTNEENFSCSEEYSSKEEALEKAPIDLALDPGGRFYIGKKRSFDVGVLDSDTYLEQLTGQSEDELGDWSDDWVGGLFRDSELKEFIEKKGEEIRNYIMEKNEPSFFLVDDAEEVFAGES